MNNEILKSGKNLSFFQLIKNYRIVIPIIQRDYAQGREDQKEVRENFLNSIYDYLINNKPLNLDFVYGTVRDNEFIPLDGQQRLTTLFLLHWYLYNISDNEDLRKKFRNAIQRDGKSMFSYETRSSSTEFCNALVYHDIDMKNLKNNSVKETIKNSSWYYLSWNYDPTISAMLTMLDAIHKRFNAQKSFFKKLLDEENPAITFKFLNLKDYHLTDDLYIKMNSRGKPLTPFENFKAQFESYIDKLNIENGFKLNGRNVSAREYFSFKIDTDWADFFWTYRNLQNRSGSQEDNNFDDELMNFIRVIFTFKYTEKLDIKSKAKDDALEYLLGTDLAKRNPDYSDVISFYKYQELGVLPKNDSAKDIVLFLINVFDNITSSSNNKLTTYLDEKYKAYYDEETIFKSALKHDFKSYHERLMFYAWLSYILKNKDNMQKNNFNQWMRVMHNLTHPDNTTIDSATDFAGALKSIRNILSEDNDIIEYLKDESKKISFFSSWQVTEERIKAHLIAKSKEWKKEIEELEKHGYFNGQIGFILEFSGIWDYYKQHRNCDWDDGEDKKYFENFKNYSEIAKIIFANSYENRINDEDYIFERAVLVKGDYLTEASACRRNLLSTSQVKNNIKRDHSWKRLLRIVDDEKWGKRRNLVKQVFDNVIKEKKQHEDFTKENIVRALGKIISTRQGKLENWRDYFINCPALFEYSKQGFIRFEDKDKVKIYKESQSNFYQVEMHTYYLWKRYIEPYLQAKPEWKKHQYPLEYHKKEQAQQISFNSVRYEAVQGINNKPKIIFESNYCKIYITYDNGYKIGVFPQNNNELDDDFKKFFTEKGFYYNKESNKYEKLFNNIKTEDDLKKIKNLIFTK